MPISVPLPWGSVDIYEPDAHVEGLQGSDMFWAGHPWRRPTLVYGLSDVLTYVAEWPTDEPAPGAAALHILNGVVFGEPRTALHCFACGGDTAGLNIDYGSPLNRWDHANRHAWVERCPHCDASMSESRLPRHLALPSPSSSLR